jgi:hypothetical protein
VIVDDLDVERVAVIPVEADPPLIIDPDAMLTLPISREFFQAIPRRHFEVAQRISRVQQEELLQGRSVNILWELSRALAVKDLLSLWVFVFEAPNHGAIITFRVNNVKRYVIASP